MPVDAFAVAPALPNNEHWWLWVPDRARCARLSGTTRLIRFSNSQAVIARSEATKQSILFFTRRDGLLRCARNDVTPISDTTARSRGAMRPRFAKTVRPAN